MKRTARRWVAVASTAAAVAAMTSAGLGGAALASNSPPVTGAAFTTVNPTDGTGTCLNGNPGVNCNIYTDKAFVWLNGGPSTAYVGAGSYFFAVLVPGGQHDPNDGAVDNLSDDANGDYTTRTFSVDADGNVTYTQPPGTHDLDGNLIRLMPYDDTTNPGGVYIMAICSLDGTPSYPVTPSRCKYDAFKIRTGTPNTGNGSDLAIDKTANAAFDRAYTWDISKSVDKTRVVQSGGTATFNYTVTVTHEDAVDGNYQITGDITVTNSNPVGVDANVSDALVTADTNQSCVLDDSNNVDGSLDTTISASSAPSFPYTCTYDGDPSSLTGTNSATVAWDQTTWSDSGTDFTLPAGSADAFANYSFAVDTTTDECVSVSDVFNGGTATDLTPSGDICATTTTSESTDINYQRVITVDFLGCRVYDNTATFTTNDTETQGSDDAEVTVCGHSGALTMGFWQNKNGQGIVLNYSGTNCQALATWLKGFHPFSDLTATTCGTSPSLTGKSTTAPSGVVGYVYTVIKAATCTSTSKTCNSMLKAQMLATALDVYFSDSIANGYGGNRINAPHPIGGITIDLQNICKMIDGTGGTATCSGTYEDVSSAFGGATSMTVLNMLLYQNTSDPAVDAGANWYGQVKATQVLAKDAFDAINNQVAFSL
jgi:hypothetical protein